MNVSVNKELEGGRQTRAQDAGCCVGERYCFSPETRENGPGLSLFTRFLHGLGLQRLASKFLDSATRFGHDVVARFLPSSSAFENLTRSKWKGVWGVVHGKLLKTRRPSRWVQVDLSEPYQARQAPAVGQCGLWEEGVREAIHVEGGQPHCILGGEFRPGLKVLEQIEIARDCEGDQCAGVGERTRLTGNKNNNKYKKAHIVTREREKRNVVAFTAGPPMDGHETK